MEKIGLEGVFETSQFASGLAKYTSGLSSAVGDTTSAGGAIGNAISSAVTTGLEAAVGAVTIGIEAFTALAVGAVTASVAVASALLAITVEAGKSSHELEILAAKTGLSTTALQEWGYAGQFLGVSADEVATYFFRLSRSMYAASNGTKASVDAFKVLGVNVTDNKGHLRDLNTVFMEAIAALGKIKDPAQADAVAMAIFGRSAQDLFPLIKAGVPELEKLQQAAHDVGAVLSDEVVKAFAQFDDNLDTIKSGIKGMSAAFASLFTPELINAEDAVIALMVQLHKVTTLTGLVDFFDNFLTPAITGMLYSITKNIPGLVVTAKAILTTFGKIIKDNAPLLLYAFRDLFGAAWKGLQDILPTLFSTGFDIANTIFKALTGKTLSFASVLDVVIGTVQDITATVWTWIQSIPWLSIAGGIADTLFTALTGKPLSFASVLDTIFGAAQGLADVVLKWARDVPWTSLSDGIATSISKSISNINWSKYGTEFRNIGKTLWSAISDALFGHPETSMNMSTHQMETNLVGGIDWSKLASSSTGTGFNDFVVGLITPGGNYKANVQDVLDANKKHLQDMIDEYGKANVIKAEWSVVVEPIFSILGDSLSAEAQREATIFGDAFTYDWQVVWSQSLGQGGTALNFIATLFEQSSQFWITTGTNLANLLGGGFSTAWNGVANDVVNAVNKVIIAINKALGAYGVKIPLLTLSGGANPEKLDPNPDGERGASLIPNNTASIPNMLPYSGSFASVSSPAARTNIFNTTVNNPSAEPASISVNSVLKKLSYLGVPA